MHRNLPLEHLRHLAFSALEIEERSLFENRFAIRIRDPGCVLDAMDGIPNVFGGRQPAILLLREQPGNGGCEHRVLGIDVANLVLERLFAPFLG